MKTAISSNRLNDPDSLCKRSSAQVTLGYKPQKKDHNLITLNKHTGYFKL